MRGKGIILIGAISAMFVLPPAADADGFETYTPTELQPDIYYPYELTDPNGGTTTGQTKEIYLKDIDNDGDEDVVVLASLGVLVYQNEGGTFRFCGHEGGPIVGRQFMSRLRFGRFSNDSYLDLVTTDNNRDVHIFTIREGCTFGEHYWTRTDGLTSMEVINYGAQSIIPSYVVYSNSRSENGEYTWYKLNLSDFEVNGTPAYNNGTPIVTYPFSSGAVKKSYAVDMNDDGLVDVATVSGRGNFSILYNSPAGIYTYHTYDMKYLYSRGKFYNIICADFNDDDVMDVALEGNVSISERGVVIMRGTPSRVEPPLSFAQYAYQLRGLDSELNAIVSFAVGDFDSNGRLDLVGCSGKTTDYGSINTDIEIFYNADSIGVKPLSSMGIRYVIRDVMRDFEVRPTSTSIHVTTIDSGDYNGDGYVDLMGGLHFYNWDQGQVVPDVFFGYLTVLPAAR